MKNGWNILAAITALAALISVFLAFQLSEASTDKAETSQTSGSSGLPGLALGEPRLVSFDADDAALADAFKSVETAALDSERQQEQKRDWLLTAALLAIGEPLQTFVGIAIDAPFARVAYSGITTSPQHGPVRYGIAQEGSLVVVLVPQDFASDLRRDAIGRSADAAVAQLLGQRPQRIALIEYCLRASESKDEDILRLLQPPMDLTTGGFKLIELISAERVYSSEFGWVDAIVSSPEELTKFLTSTDDLVTVHWEDDALYLEGRDYAARPYGQLITEHVATLWQAYGRIDQALEERNERLNRLISEFAERAVLAELAGLRSSGELPVDDVDALIAFQKSGRRSFVTQREAEMREVLSVLRKRAEKDIRGLVEAVQQDYGSCNWRFRLFELDHKKSEEKGANLAFQSFGADFFRAFDKAMSSVNPEKESLLRGAIGFSLDPAYDIDVLKADFEKFIATDKSGVAKVFDPFIDDIRAELQQGSTKLLLCALGLYENRGAQGREIVQAANRLLLDRSSYQTARYDGGIAGTEVGQILFFTDLLAKLLDMDFSGSFREYFTGAIGAWRPTVRINPPVHLLEQIEKLPSTRIWFGMRPESSYIAPIDADSRSFQADRIGFAPIATRVFALSRGILSREDETQPSYMADLFVSWFNNNYDRVAAAETRYDQLNQLIKWSKALGTIHDDSSGPGFLNSVPVRRNLWFPTWALVEEKQNAKKWANCFHKRGKFSQHVETLPVFHTQWPDAPKDWCDAKDDNELLYWSIRGGVSLPGGGDRAVKTARLSDFTDIPKSMRRAYVAEGTLTRRGSGVSRATEFERTEAYGLKVRYNVEFSTSRGKITRNATPVKKGTLKAYSRGARTETASARAETRLELDAGTKTLTATETVGELPVARTTFTPREDVIQIRHELDVFEVAKGVSSRLTRLPKGLWREALLADPRVQAVLSAEDGAVFVKLKRQSQWVELRGEPKPAVEIAEGYQARVGESLTPIERGLLYPDGKTKPAGILLRVADDAKISQLLVLRNWREVVRTPRRSGDFALDIRGPPSEPPTPPSTGILASSPGEGPRFFICRGGCGNKGPPTDGPGGPRAPSGRGQGERLLIGIKDDAQTSEMGAEKAAAYRVEQFNKTIDELSTSVMPEAVPETSTQLVHIPRHATGKSLSAEAMAALRSQRDKAFEADLITENGANQIITTRQSYIDAIILAHRARQRDVAKELRREFSARFNLTAVERQRLASIELADALKTIDPAAKTAPLLTATKVDGHLVSRVVGDITLRQGADAGNRAAAAAHRTLADHLSGRADEFIRFERKGSAMVGDLSCIMRRQDTRVAELPENAALYIDVRLGLQPVPDLLKSGQDLVVLRMPDSLKSVENSLGVSRPDFVQLNERFTFRINPTLARPRLKAKAVADAGGETPDLTSFFGRMTDRLAGEVNGGEAASPSVEDLGEVFFVAPSDTSEGLCFSEPVSQADPRTESTPDSG